VGGQVERETERVGGQMHGTVARALTARWRSGTFFAVGPT
jgi:hypothetical protein